MKKSSPVKQDKKKYTTKNILGGLKSVRTFIKHHPPLQFIALGIFFAIIFLGPYLDIDGARDFNFNMSSVLIYSVAALGLNLLLGFGGLISLATAGFMGLGALGLVVLVQDFGIPLEFAIIIILIIGAGAGALVGAISLRVEGIYLAITTLFISEILLTVFTSFSAWFGNNSRDLGPIKLLGSIELDQKQSYLEFRTENFVFDRYILLLILTVFLVISMIIVYNIIKSRTGRAYMAMSRSNNAAQAMGINVIKYRLGVFMVATVFATLSGVMFMMWNQSSSNSRWDLMISLTIIAIVVVGGLKSIFGTVLGAFVIYAFPRIFLNEILGDLSLAFGGLLIILVILFYPQGVIRIPSDLVRGSKALYAKLKKKWVTRHDN